MSTRTPVDYVKELEQENAALEAALASARGIIEQVAGCNVQLHDLGIPVAVAALPLSVKKSAAAWLAAIAPLREKDAEWSKDYWDGMQYARNLFKNLAPQCDVCSTLTSVLTQIDNWCAGARQRADAAESALAAEKKMAMTYLTHHGKDRQ